MGRKAFLTLNFPLDVMLMMESYSILKKNKNEDDLSYLKQRPILSHIFAKTFHLFKCFEVFY